MTWKRIGSTTPPPKPPTADSSSSSSSSGDAPVAEPATIPRPPPIPPPLPNFNRRIPPPPNTVDPLAQILSARRGALPEDEPEADVIDSNKPKLTLEGDVVRWMIKKMEETWTEFYDQIDTTTMLFPRLTLFFGPIHRKQIPQEMELLVLTGNSGYNKEWIQVIHLN